MLTKRKVFTGAVAAVAAISLGLALLPVTVLAQGTITQIIDGSGDGAGNTLGRPQGIAVDGAGNVYVAGFGTDMIRTDGIGLTDAICAHEKPEAQVRHRLAVGIWVEPGSEGRYILADRIARYAHDVQQTSRLFGQ